MNKRKQLPEPILAEGEVTGHAHRLTGVTVYERPDGLREFNADEPTYLTHEEHGVVKIPAGHNLSGRVRELDAAGEARNVAD